jgi:diguanylate cyclase (GGDEF)-like protein/PAS domain S-box-containing protein
MTEPEFAENPSTERTGERAGNPSVKAMSLYQTAAERLRQTDSAYDTETEDSDLQRLVSELQVHQIELEMQNEELKRARAELDAERARYFDLYNLAPVGYCTLSEHGLIQQTNPAFAALLGSRRGALVGQPLSRFIVREDAELYDQHRLPRAGNEKPAACELRMTKEDGTLFWASLTLSVGQERDGAAVLRAVLSDISDRKRAEDALREHTEFFQLIAENIGDFIVVLDREGRRLYNSPSYARFFGGTRNLQGTDSFADVHPDDQERVKQVFRETVQSGWGRHMEYRLRIADGSMREMESHGSVIKGPAGRVERVVVVSQDITERKQMERQVRQLAFHDALTQLPNRRLLDDRLQQALVASTRSACHGAVMFLDLDNFKRLNDRYGHGVGDSLLIEAADRLKSCVREMDTVARFGGDEFVVMVSELALDRNESLAQARLIAEKIGASLAAVYRLTVRQGGKPAMTVEHRCTVSIGVVLFSGTESSQEDILRWADSAMYRAKKAGRNAIRFHGERA